MITSGEIKQPAIRGLAGLLDRHNLNNLSTGDVCAVCDSLSLMLTHAFTMVDESGEMYDWTVGSLDAEAFIVRDKTISLSGNINWLIGGGLCKTYQAIVALNTTPILYTFNLIDRDGTKRFSIRKSYNGWKLASLCSA